MSYRDGMTWLIRYQVACRRDRKPSASARECVFCSGRTSSTGQCRPFLAAPIRASPHLEVGPSLRLRSQATAQESSGRDPSGQAIAASEWVACVRARGRKYLPYGVETSLLQGKGRLRFSLGGLIHRTWSRSRALTCTSGWRDPCRPILDVKPLSQMIASRGN